MHQTRHLTLTAANRIADLALVALRGHLYHDSHLERLLDKAYAYERKGRSGSFYAKTVLVECVVRGFANDLKPSDLISFSDGCRDAYVIGAHLAAKGKDTADLRERLGYALEAQRKMTQQRVAGFGA